MSNIKEQSIEIIKQLPDDVTIEDIVDAILNEQIKKEFEKEIKESEEDIEKGRVHSARLVFKELEEKYGKKI